MATGLAIAMADGGIVSTGIELAAMLKEVRGAAKKYPTNSIIQVAFGRKSNYTAPDAKSEDTQSDALIDQAIDRINAALAVAAGKASNTEVAEYKQFICDCGMAAASAAGKGPFGTGREKVSEAETAALTKIKAALGI
ncbi:MAG: hypothetical protein WBG38_07140 [Nodosilinea sp.]